MRDNIKKYLTITCLSIFNVITSTSTLILLPIYVQSYKDEKNNKDVNPYFVTFIGSIMYIVPYIIYQLYRTLRYHQSFFVTITPQKKFLIIGFFSAFYEILIIYSSPEIRVPVDIRGILLQTAIPISLLFSYLIKHEKLNKNQIIGAFIVFVGILTSLIPIFISLGYKTGIYNISNILWCLILVCGLFCDVMVNIYVDLTLKEFKEIDIGLLMLWSSIYQLIIVIMFFWIDFIPYFGLSGTFNNWKESFVYGFKCSFSNIGAEPCKNTFVLLISYCMINILEFIAVCLILKYTTANFYMILNSLISPISVTFWIIIPTLQERVINILTIIMDYIAVVIILTGICIYVKKKHLFHLSDLIIQV